MKKKRDKYVLEKVMIAQVRYYETLFKIKDDNGQVIFTGNETLANRMIKLLNENKRKVQR